jgi:hypothetical protein
VICLRLAGWCSRQLPRYVACVNMPQRDWHTFSDGCCDKLPLMIGGGRHSNTLMDSGQAHWLVPTQDFVDG